MLSRDTVWLSRVAYVPVIVFRSASQTMAEASPLANYGELGAYEGRPAALTDTASEPSTSGTETNSLSGSGSGYIYHKVGLAFCCTDIGLLSPNFVIRACVNLLCHPTGVQARYSGWLGHKVSCNGEQVAVCCLYLAVRQ